MLDKLDLSQKIDKQTYKLIMSAMRERLFNVQKASWDANIPVIILFEGWDAAGKGTLINKLIQPLDPRGFKVHPINPPNEDEKLRPFLWRFWIN